MTSTDLVALTVSFLRTSDLTGRDLSRAASDLVIDLAVDGGYELDDGEIEIIVEAAEQRLA